MAALQKGVEGAYKAVMKPTEGTILTVARVASEEAAASDAADVPALWDVVLTAGQKALEDTPQPAARAEEGRRCGRRRSGHYGHL